MSKKKFMNSEILILYKFTSWYFFPPNHLKKNPFLIHRQYAHSRWAFAFLTICRFVDLWCENNGKNVCDSDVNILLGVLISVSFVQEADIKNETQHYALSSHGLDWAQATN